MIIRVLNYWDTGFVGRGYSSMYLIRAETNVQHSHNTDNSSCAGPSQTWLSWESKPEHEYTSMVWKPTLPSFLPKSCRHLPLHGYCKCTFLLRCSNHTKHYVIPFLRMAVNGGYMEDSTSLLCSIDFVAPDFFHVPKIWPISPLSEYW